MQLSPILARVPAASFTTCVAIAKSCRDKLTRRVRVVFCHYSVFSKGHVCSHHVLLCHPVWVKTAVWLKDGCSENKASNTALLCVERVLKGTFVL